MNLFSRLLYTLITAFMKKRTDYFSTTTVKFRVWPLDLDINGHMTNSRYLSVMDLGRIDYMIRTGFLAKIKRLKITPVLGSSIIRWRKSLRCFESFELHTTMLGWNDKWMYIQQRITRNNQVISDAMVKGIFINDRGSIFMKDLNHQVNLNIDSPALSDKIKLWTECEEAMRVNVTQEFNQSDVS